MGLESLLARLKNDVADVSDVSALIHKGFSCNVIKTADVANVSDHDLTAISAISATSATASKNQTFQPEPAWNKACTSATSETCKKINAELGFVAATQKPPTPTTTVQVNLPTPDVKGLPTNPADDTVIDVGTVRPAGLSAKLLAASLALDAQIHAAGQFDNSDENLDRHCWTESTAWTGSEIDTFTARLARFTGKGVIQSDAEALADKLVQRDRDSDDRRICLECPLLQGYGRASWRCGNWQAAGISTNPRSTQLAADPVLQLQRCDGFRSTTP